MSPAALLDEFQMRLYDILFCFPSPMDISLHGQIAATA
jgi:hypothetical protein